MRPGGWPPAVALALAIVTVATLGIVRTARAQATAARAERPGVRATSPHRACPPNPSEHRSLATYRDLALMTKPSFFGGVELYRGDQRLDLGHWGGRGAHIFRNSADALGQLRLYRRLRISATVLFVTGSLLVLTDIVMLVAGVPALARSATTTAGSLTEVRPLFWGLLAGGGSLMFAGHWVGSAAAVFLDHAVDRHNAELSQRLMLARTAAGPTLGVRLGGHF